MQLDADELRQRLKPAFRENFEKLGELGAAVSIWQNGKPVVDLYDGFCDARHEKPWEADALVLVWSATKGIGSACVLHVLQEHRIGINRCVAEFWPEFAQAGKEKITLSQLLSHQAGLCALDRRVDILDYSAVIRALEVQKPLCCRGPHMVITVARLDSFSMNSCVGSPGKRSPSIGAKSLRSH